MKTVILQSNYIPWSGYFDLINDADLFIFYDEVKYTKNDWRNRNKICGSNGSFWLTIPIAKDAVKIKISEVRLPGGNWRDEHLSKIYHCYKKQPYFNEIYLTLETALKKDFEFLSELNRYLIKIISEKSGIKTIFKNSSEYELKSERIERLIHLLVQTGATEYISGPSAKEYLKNYESIFIQNNIKLSYKNYHQYKQYKQPYKIFQPFVSIIDLIASIGFDSVIEYF